MEEVVSGVPSSPANKERRAPCLQGNKKVLGPYGLKPWAAGGRSLCEAVKKLQAVVLLRRSWARRGLSEVYLYLQKRMGELRDSFRN